MNVNFSYDFTFHESKIRTVLLEDTTMMDCKYIFLAATRRVAMHTT
jgi:hypothetical protein